MGKAYVPGSSTVKMWENYPTEPWVQLHTGAPGSEGKENIAPESKRKKAKLKDFGRKTENEAALEWTAVAEKQTITHVALFQNEKEFLGEFYGWIELEKPVELEAGDTFRFNIGKLALEIKE